MTSYLQYNLVNGFVQNWLIGGPHVLPIQNLRFSQEDNSPDLRATYQALPSEYRDEMIDMSVEPLEMVKFNLGDTQLGWQYYRCQDDHMIDLSASYPSWKYLTAWTYSIVKLPDATKARLQVAAYGPVTLWVNGALVHQYEGFHSGQPKSSTVDVNFVQGENKLLLRLENIGVRAFPYQAAVQVLDLSEDAEKKSQVLVPTQAKYPRRHEIVEATFEKAFLEETVNHRGAHFNLHWADDIGTKMKYEFQVQDKDKFSYVDGFGETDSEKPVDVGHHFRIKERQMYVALRPILLEYFDHNLRYEKKFPIYVIDNAYSSAPVGTLADRTREALEDALKHEANLFAEIAKLRLGRWADFKPRLVMDRIEEVNQCEAGSENTLLGLLGMIYRFADDPNFPADLKEAMEDCVMNFPYSLDDAQKGNCSSGGLAYGSETANIVFLACEALAGQRYPQKVFTRSGKDGVWHRERAQKLSLDWLRKRGTYGFPWWNSNDAYEIYLMAFSHLAALAEDVDLRELSAVMIDKLLFSMAVNSFKGAFGSTHGETSADMVKSAQMEATSGVSRMMWGTGVYNAHILGTVSLAAAEYEFPLLIGEIATEVKNTVLVRERQVVDGEKGIEVNTVTYKTPDFMLSSAQDYRPGEGGRAEHVWQATLGPDAIVFANHPASMHDSEAHRPGFWLGNRTLPRVAQWKDVLIAVHQLPEDDWMGYTHAYFPIYKFSEYEIRRNQRSKGDAWAFARKDNGYLALTASQGFDLVQRAPDGNRELRSYGKNNIWVCHMGSAETDGNFEKFKKRILTMKLEWKERGVHLKTLRGDNLAFGWEDSLMVNEEEQTLHGFKHHESLYGEADLPAEQLEIQYQGTIMRIDFS